MVIPSSPNAQKPPEVILKSPHEEQLFGALMGDLPSSPLSREVWRAGLFTDFLCFVLFFLAIIGSIVSPPFLVWKSGYYQMQMKKFCSKLLNLYVQVQRNLCLHEERACVTEMSWISPVFSLGCTISHNITCPLGGFGMTFQRTTTGRKKGK